MATRTIVIRRAAQQARRAVQPIIVRAPAAMKHVKHHGRKIASAAYEERHRMGAILGGLALGLIEKAGIDLPTIPLLGKAGTLGVAAWAMGKWGKSRIASHAATGFLAIAAFELGKEGHINGLDGYVAGGGYASGL